METKYYQPSIEEFRVGFEFERKNTLDKRKWVKCTFKDGESAEQYCEENNSRVKYLDSEDIESLGFKLYIKDNFIYCQYKELEIYLDYNIENNLCKIYTLDENLFKGIIKNKSELKFIIKCLGIKE